jgi:pimeloyl-ACP methyl ester carboxylesterase
MGDQQQQQLPKTMQGTLHRFSPSHDHLAFVSSSSDLHVVLIGGLGDGLLSLPYAPLLAERCASAGKWALVQAQLGSSYAGWRWRRSLSKDAEEVLLLLAWLKRELGSRGVVIIGHSTGAQIACETCRRLGQGGGGSAAAPLLPPLLGVVLQGAVSDRDYFFAAAFERSAACLADARRICETRGAAGAGEDEEPLTAAEIVDGIEGGAAVARRAVSLLERLGGDDMFSRDLSVEEMREKTAVGWLTGRPGQEEKGGGDKPGRREVLVLASGADEYALPLLTPEEEKDETKVKSKHRAIAELAERVAEAAGPGARAVTIPGATHDGGRGTEMVVAAIEGLLAAVAAAV